MSQAPQQQSSAAAPEDVPQRARRPVLVLSNHENEVEWQRRVLAMITELAEHRGIVLESAFEVEVHSAAWWARDRLASLPEDSIVIALLSEAFLGAMPSEQKLDQMLERIGRSVQVIPVVALPCAWEATPFVTRQAFPRSRRSLSDAPADSVDEELLFIAELALSHCAPKATEPHADAHTFDDLRELPLADSVALLIHRAALAAAAPDQRSMMLAVMASSGKREGESLWVCDVLRRAVLNGSAPDVVSDYMNFTEKGAEPAAMSAPLQPELYDVFTSARGIARRTSSDETIHARHLLAALMVADRGADASILETLGVARDGFTKELIQFVTFDRAERRAEWERILLGEAAPDRRLFDFHADSPGDTDLLGIDRDVAAFATLIAARDVNPPLSVGLFGDWGSGKSFFMRQLRKGIEELAHEARASNAMQCNWPFYKRIVQVEFNAWHYVDGNLWASLVQHILDNLRAPGDKSTSRQLQQHLLKELKFASSTELEARAAVVAATTAVTDTKETLAEAESELEAKRGELEKLAATDVTTTFVLEGVASFAKETMSELRIEPVDASAEELKKALSGAHAVVSGGSPLLTQLQRSKDRSRRRFQFAVSVFAVPVVVVLVRWYLSVLDVDLSGLSANIASFATAAAGFLSGLIVWVKKGSAWLEARRKEVDEVQKRYDARVAELLAEHSRKVSTLGEAVQQQANDLATAKQKHEEAKQRVAAATAELEDATSGRLLARFVEDRAGSTDYRKHLGVLAVVRRDFESLSDLIQEENWRMLPPIDGEDETERIKPKFTTLEEERKDENVRINRIVLYIDDLDRCPPGKVVEVLQAVHLLLAFPLFVVVVGVDARWIARSLESRYRELLLSDKSNSGDRFEEVFGRATTNDYLEKIFQVPYWIRPMDLNASSQMIRGLLQRSVAPTPVPTDETRAAPRADPPAASPRAPAGATRTTAVGGTSATSATPATPPQTREAATPRSTDPTAVNGPPTNASPANGANGSNGSSASNGDKSTIARQQLASLVVHRAELDIIDTLTPLLGRSPRSLKRFVNVYRLLKAGLSPDEQDEFHGADKSDSWAVLFLLAIDTGAPLAAHPIFDAVSGIAISNAPMLQQLRTHLNNRIALEVKQRIVTPDWAADWGRVDRWLETQPDVCSNPAVMAALDQWAPRVARYSFHAVREKLG